MTPREPDRYEAKGVETWRALRIMTEADAAPIIAAALRQAADEALEKAAVAFAEAPTTQHSGAAVASVLRYLARDSAPQPAAAPAAEPCPEPPPGLVETLEKVHGMGCGNIATHRIPAPPSEPVAPAKDQLRDPVALLKRARPYVHSQWCRPGIRSAEIDRAEELLNDIDAALADGGEGK